MRTLLCLLSIIGLTATAHAAPSVFVGKIKVNGKTESYFLKQSGASLHGYLFTAPRLTVRGTVRPSGKFSAQLRSGSKPHGKISGTIAANKISGSGSARLTSTRPAKLQFVSKPSLLGAVLPEYDISHNDYIFTTLQESPNHVYRIRVVLMRSGAFAYNYRFSFDCKQFNNFFVDGSFTLKDGVVATFQVNGPWWMSNPGVSISVDPGNPPGNRAGVDVRIDFQDHASETYPRDIFAGYFSAPKL
jgi:hypothetical protein